MTRGFNQDEVRHQVEQARRDQQEVDLQNVFKLVAQSIHDIYDVYPRPSRAVLEVMNNCAVRFASGLDLWITAYPNTIILYRKGFHIVGQGSSLEDAVACRVYRPQIMHKGTSFIFPAVVYPEDYSFVIN